MVQNTVFSMCQRENMYVIIAISTTERNQCHISFLFRSSQGYCLYDVSLRFHQLCSGLAVLRIEASQLLKLISYCPNVYDGDTNILITLISVESRKGKRLVLTLYQLLSRKTFQIKCLTMFSDPREGISQLESKFINIKVRSKREPQWGSTQF